MAMETYEAVQTQAAAESGTLIHQLFQQFTLEWQQVAIVSAIIVLFLGVGLTEVAKRMDLFGLFNSNLPKAMWRRHVQLFAFTSAFLYSVMLLPLVVLGSGYAIVAKVLVAAMVNAVLTLLGFDTIRLLARKFRQIVLDRLKARFSK